MEVLIANVSLKYRMFPKEVEKKGFLELMRIYSFIKWESDQSKSAVEDGNNV